MKKLIAAVVFFSYGCTTLQQDVSNLELEVRKIRHELDALKAELALKNSTPNDSIPTDYDE